MAVLEVDQDILAFVLALSRATGESPSVLLRHEFGLPAAQGGSATSSSGTPVPKDRRHLDLLKFVEGPSFKAIRIVTKRYLALLGFLHGQDPARFERVLEIGGRHRKYFGHSSEEVAKSGKSLHPRQVPSSPFWVMTNADSRQKRELLRQVLAVLEFDGPTTDRVIRSI